MSNDPVFPQSLGSPFHFPRPECGAVEERVQRYPAYVQWKIRPLIRGLQSGRILVGLLRKITSWLKRFTRGDPPTSNDVVEAAWEAGVGVHALIWVS